MYFFAKGFYFGNFKLLYKSYLERQSLIGLLFSILLFVHFLFQATLHLPITIYHAFRLLPGKGRERNRNRKKNAKRYKKPKRKPKRSNFSS